MERLLPIHHGPPNTPIRKWLSALVLVVGLVLSATPSWAVVVQKFGIKNNSGAARSDLHLIFTGTGGAATLAVTNNPAGCGAPVITNPGSPWDITWSNACVQVGDVVEISITSAAGGVAFSSGTWSPGGVNLPAGDVTAVTVPGASPWTIGMVVLLLAVAGAAALAFRKRRSEDSLPA